MRTFTRLVSVFLLTAIGNLFFLSCSGREKNVPAVSILEIALQQAGENRVELEKVLSRYQIDPADSLKYRAACFLIENMPYYTYYKGKQLDRYFTYYALLQKTRGLGISPQVVADSVRHMYGPLYLDSLQSYRDIETVDSAYLCNNIEWSFKVWQEQPWGKHVSFADFCEYLLPYRIGDETLASWRESIYQKYNLLLDSLRASGVGLVFILIAIFAPITTKVSMPVFLSSLSFGMVEVPIGIMFLALCGLCTSIMWGGIFNLAVEGLGKYTEAASGFFMVMVCGGGILPLIQGVVADNAGFQASYFVILVGLAYLLYFALVGSKNVNKDIPVD